MIKCIRCGGKGRESHSYCKPCKAQYQREQRGSGYKNVSKYPKPRETRKTDDYGYFY